MLLDEQEMHLRNSICAQVSGITHKCRGLEGKKRPLRRICACVTKLILSAERSEQAEGLYCLEAQTERCFKSSA